MQPSEFVKPTFAVIAAWLFAESRENSSLPGNKLATALFMTIVVLLLLQPDVGMTSVVAAIWGIEFLLNLLIMFIVSSIYPNKKLFLSLSEINSEMTPWKHTKKLSIILCLTTILIYIGLGI